MKSTTTIILMFLISFSGFSQETISGSTIKNTNLENSSVFLSFVVKNEVSATMTAHTYKLNNGSELNVIYIDSAPQTSNPLSINTIIDKFLAEPGVSECTFDKATQTFTVLSEPTVNLLSTVQSINEN